jgi:hypothetical protein
MAVQQPTGRDLRLAQTSQATKKGGRSHPGFCPPRRYSAMKMPLRRVRFSDKRK